MAQTWFKPVIEKAIKKPIKAEVIFMFSPNKTLRALALCLSCVSTSSWAAVDAPTASTPIRDGYIELRDSNNALLCSIDFKQGTYPLNVSDGPCPSDTWDDVVYFRLVDVPSASTFTLFDSETCSQDPRQAFIFTFKVVKHPTTMLDSMSIATAGATPVGSLVQGVGLRMERRMSNRPASDLLGCVQITRSAVPEN